MKDQVQASKTPTQPDSTTAFTSATATSATTTMPTTQDQTDDPSQTHSQSQIQQSPPPFSQTQSHPPEAQDQTHPPPTAAASDYPHQIHGVGGPMATTPFLQDFSLVAEAAKRAQMAVVMRDLEGISL